MEKSGVCLFTMGSLLRLAWKLQTFVYVAVTGIYDKIFNKFTILLDPINTFWEKPIPWWIHKFMVKESTLYASAFKSYNE